MCYHSYKFKCPFILISRFYLQGNPKEAIEYLTKSFDLYHKQCKEVVDIPINQWKPGKFICLEIYLTFISTVPSFILFHK